MVRRQRDASRLERIKKLSASNLKTRTVRCGCITGAAAVYKVSMTGKATLSCYQRNRGKDKGILQDIGKNGDHKDKEKAAYSDQTQQRRRENTNRK